LKKQTKKNQTDPVNSQAIKTYSVYSRFESEGCWQYLIVQRHNSMVKFLIIQKSRRSNRSSRSASSCHKTERRDTVSRENIHSSVTRVLRACWCRWV